ncbi:hypothetical protein EDC45_1486 [Mesocricetibacter intestinalis]|uniref:Z-ring associated protein G n=1 Tax=Mesocricetibacter intestinalis TaxID=1521930 RepID=A0A4R6V869_9PAST|nr:DUF1043 family protein [Mesocricetibacter intestinalis]TDQ57425.1 hypothetical protein EDC45_1486 [Mesocricetibacter intestinalis]
MQVWTTQMWQAAAIGLVLGLIIGYVIVRLTKGSVKKQVKTEAELQQVKAQLDTQKQQLEKHFSESADLLKTMADDYQKLYRHLAQSSARLLPESSDKLLFVQPAQEKEESPDSAADSPALQKKEDQPRDYSEGSSGILKAER